MTSHPELDRLLETFAAMRGEHGCAWCDAQTHESLVPYLVEEAYELVDAIESGDAAHIREELGDVLFQVLFHADIAARDAGEGAFSLEDVARDQADKLLRRNPHVFGPTPTRDIDEIIAMWRAAKAVEKRERMSALDGIPAHLPALSRADKVLGRAAGLGIRPPVAAAPAAVRAEPAGDGGAPAEARFGDELLALVARARAEGVDAEQALRRAVRGLETRIREVETTATKAPGETGTGTGEATAG